MLLLTAALVIAQVAPDVPNQQPWLAASGGQTALAFGSGKSIYVAISNNDGKSFGTPVQLPNTLPLALGRHRGPRVAFAGRTIVVSAIVGSTGRGQDGDLVAWRSTDAGKSWSEPVRLNDVTASAREGLHSMAAHGNRLFAAWLDLRSQGTRIYGSWSEDNGATWSKNLLVYESPDGTVCQCCHPTVLMTSSRDVHVMFRNALGGSRDMYVARSRDGGKTFAAGSKLGSGTWKLNACPMDGGALAVQGDRVVAAFRRDKEIVVAGDDKAETAVGAGRDPVIAIGKKGRYIAWASMDAVHVLEPGQTQPRVLGPGGKYVHLVTTPSGGVVAAWEQDNTIVTARLAD